MGFLLVLASPIGGQPKASLPPTLTGPARLVGIPDQHLPAKRLDLAPYTEVLEDPTGSLSFGEARRRTGWKSDARAVQPGFSRSAWWLRFSAHGPAAATRSQAGWRILEAHYPLLDRVDLFYSMGGVTVWHRSGDRVPMHAHEIVHRSAAFRLPDTEPEDGTFYLRIQTGSSADLQFSVWSSDAFQRKVARENLVFGILFGMLFVMGLYNLFLYFSLRDRSYLYYVLATFSLLGVYVSLNGFAFAHVLPRFPEIAGGLPPPLVLSACAWLLFFTREFMAVSGFAPRLDRWLRLVGVVLIGFAVISPWIPYGTAIKLGVAASLLVPSAAFCIGCYGQFLRQRSSGLFLLAWTAFLVGTVLRVLKTTGALPATLVTEHAMELGSALEVVLLSLALADRINQMRREKEQSARELAKKDRLSMVGQVVASMVHDFRGPVSVIQGYAEYLGEDRVTDEERNEYSQRMLEEVENLKQMATEVLDFSKDKILLVQQPVDVSFFLNGFRKEVEMLLLDDSVQLDFMVSDSGVLSMDPARIKRVLFNLIQNAIEALAEGGGRVDVRALRQGSYYVLQVADNGPGIPQEIRDTLFEPFVTHGKRQGSGLGTAIAKKIVEEHGGSIWFESAAGGTTFYIRLPAL